MRRVVVTGLGVVSSIGNNAEEVKASLRDARSGAGASAVAVNVDPTESDLATVPPEEVVAAITPRADAASRAAGSLSLTLADREREQSAWWYLVVVGFLLLAAETVLSNWRRKTQTV